MEDKSKVKQGDMEKYISNLKSKKTNELKAEARENLIRTGVLNEDGTRKKRIVTWK